MKKCLTIICLLSISFCGFSQTEEIEIGKEYNVQIVIPNLYNLKKIISYTFPSYTVTQKYNCTEEYFGTTLDKIICFHFKFSDGIKGRITHSEDYFSADFKKYTTFENAIIGYYISEKFGLN